MQKSPSTCAITAAALLVAAISSVLTLLLSRYFYNGISCDISTYSAKRTGFSNKPVSDGSERIVISEKKVVVIRLHSKDRCYIAPLHQNFSAPRTFELVNEELSDALIEQFAGIDAVKFCQHQHTFLVKEPNDVNEILNRRRRQAATDPLDIPIDSRSPNCMDLLLDCGRRVVEVNNCYTWINGAMLMHRECLADNEFRVTLTKPKGRISQIQEEQWEICKERRKQGLRC